MHNAELTVFFKWIRSCFTRLFYQIVSCLSMKIGVFCGVKKSAVVVDNFVQKC